MNQVSSTDSHGTSPPGHTRITKRQIRGNDTNANRVRPYATRPVTSTPCAFFRGTSPSDPWDDRPWGDRALRTTNHKQIRHRNLRPVNRRIIIRVHNRRLQGEQVLHGAHRAQVPNVRHRRHRRTIGRGRHGTRHHRHVTGLPQGALGRHGRVQRGRLRPRRTGCSPRGRMFTKYSPVGQRPFTYMVPHTGARHGFRRPTNRVFGHTTGRHTYTRGRRPVQPPRIIRRRHRGRHTGAMSEQRQPPRGSNTVLPFTRRRVIM